MDGIIKLFNKSDRRGPSLKLNSTASFDIEFSVSEVNGTAFGKSYVINIIWYDCNFSIVIL